MNMNSPSAQVLLLLHSAYVYNPIKWLLYTGTMLTPYYCITSYLGPQMASVHRFHTCTDISIVYKLYIAVHHTNGLSIILSTHTHVCVESFQLCLGNEVSGICANKLKKKKRLM